MNSRYRKSGIKIFTEHEKQSLLKDARKIVVEAGKITNSYFKQRLIIENKQENAFNPVTVADKLTEKKMVHPTMEPSSPLRGGGGGVSKGEHTHRYTYYRTRNGVRIRTRCLL